PASAARPPPPSFPLFPYTTLFRSPAHVRGELLRLGAREQHAETERVEIAALLDPFLLVDEDAVHQRDLARRPAEAEAADLEPDTEGFGIWGQINPLIAAPGGRCDVHRRAAARPPRRRRGAGASRAG